MWLKKKWRKAKSNGILLFYWAMYLVLWLWSYSWKNVSWYCGEIWITFQAENFFWSSAAVGFGTQHTHMFLPCVLSSGSNHSFYVVRNTSKHFSLAGTGWEFGSGKQSAFPGEHRGTAKVGLQRGESTSYRTNNISKLIFWAFIQMPWIVKAYVFPWW